MTDTQSVYGLATALRDRKIGRVMVEQLAMSSVLSVIAFEEGDIKWALRLCPRVNHVPAGIGIYPLRSQFVRPTIDDAISQVFGTSSLYDDTDPQYSANNYRYLM